MVLYMRTNIHFLSYLAQFFTEWENISDKSCRESKDTRFMFNKLPPKIVPFMKCGKIW